MDDYEQAIQNLEDQCDSEKEELIAISKILAIHVMHDHMEDAYEVLGRERMEKIRDDTEYFAKNDTETLEYLKYVLDEVEG